MTPEEKRLLIELAIVALSEASPDAQRRITKLLDRMEESDWDRLAISHPGDNP